MESRLPKVSIPRPLPRIASAHMLLASAIIATSLTFTVQLSFEEFDGKVQDEAFWRPHLRRIADHFQLSTADDPHLLCPVYPGDNAVFILDGMYVVKFFADSQFTKGEQSFQTETYLYSELFAKMDIPYVPRFVTYSSLYDIYSESDQSLWRWPFLITAVIEGKPLKALKGRFTDENKLRLAADVAAVVKAFHGITVPPNGCASLQPDYWSKFINERLRICVDKHKKWQRLPPALLEQLPSYLPASAEALDPEPCVIIHGDLHHEHIFVAVGEKDGQKDVRFTGVIDFGDCCLGSPLYEFVFLYMSSFKSDKRLLRAFLDIYYPAGFDVDVFVRRCFCYTLLHEFNALNMREEGYLFDVSKVSTLEEFATLLWDVRCPEEMPRYAVTPTQQ